MGGGPRWHGARDRPKTNKPAAFADHAAIAEKARTIAKKNCGKVLGGILVLSPRLELGISRVSGGRINQLSHESASSFRSLAKTGLLLILSQPDPHVRSSPRGPS